MSNKRVTQIRTALKNVLCMVVASPNLLASKTWTAQTPTFPDGLSYVQVTGLTVGLAYELTPPTDGTSMFSQSTSAGMGGVVTPSGDNIGFMSEPYVFIAENTTAYIWAAAGTTGAVTGEFKLASFNGYSRTLLPGNFYATFDNTTVSRQLESKYPKVFIITESGNSTKQPSGRQMKKLVFLVVVIVKQVAGSDSAQEQIEDYIEDIERVIALNDTLQDTVHDAAITEFLTDSGNLHPEGAAVIRVECEYFHQF